MHIYISRHGQSLSNVGQNGGSDPGLTELGFAQAKALARRLSVHSFEAIYSSPTRRALATANEAALLQPGGPAPVNLLTELAEVDFHSGFSVPPLGELLKVCPAAALIPGPCGFDGGFPKEEDGGVSRAYAAAKYLLDRHTGQEEKILVVAHGIFNSRFISALLGSPDPSFFRVMSENAMLTKISWLPDRDGEIRSLLHYHNDISHLSGLCEERE